MYEIADPDAAVRLRSRLLDAAVYHGTAQLQVGVALFSRALTPNSYPEQHLSAGPCYDGGKSTRDFVDDDEEEGYGIPVLSNDN